MDQTGAYQIRSTPFMRRMVSTNTKNGELQRLKQEYERIKNFNERTIEKQIKQARLRRLYHVIDIIKKSLPERERPRPKTQEDLRAERIKIARKRGMEYSRNNAVAMEQHPTQQTSFHSRSENLKFRFEPHNPKEEADRRRRSHRRLAYGNDFSRQNRETFSKGSSKRLTPIETTEPVDGTEEKRKLLLKRIKKGNEYSTKNLLQWQNMKHNKEEQQRHLEKSIWLDSINETHASEWSSSAAMPAATDQIYNGVMPEPVASLGSIEDQEFRSADALPIQVPSLTRETTLTPDLTAQDDTLKVGTAAPSSQADSTFQHVRRLVLGALKLPFSAHKSKSTTDDFQQDSESLSEIETIQPLDSSSQERLHLNVEEEQTELHQVSNSTNLQSLYEQIEIRDLGSRSSDLKCAESSTDEHITPDELVLSCQRYMDNISECEDSSARRSSTYDTNTLHPFEKVIDLRSKLVDPISTHVMDKEELLKLRKVQNLRAVYEN